MEWVIDSKHTVVPATALVSLNTDEVEKGDEVAAKFGKTPSRQRCWQKVHVKLPFNTSVSLCISLIHQMQVAVLP